MSARDGVPTPVCGNDQKGRDDEAFAVLLAKRAELGTKTLAERLGYGESSIRLACTLKYPGSMEKLLSAVRRVFVEVVDCPYAGHTIGWGECGERSSSPRPFGGRAREHWWLACQQCKWRKKD